MEEELQLDVAAEVVEVERVEPRLAARVVVERARLREHLRARIWDGRHGRREQACVRLSVKGVSERLRGSRLIVRERRECTCE